jgi:hypothetical protein
MTFLSLLGFQDSFSNHFGQTYSGILENWEVVDGVVHRIEVLIEK